MVFFLLSHELLDLVSSWLPAVTSEATQHINKFGNKEISICIWLLCTSPLPRFLTPLSLQQCAGSPLFSSSFCLSSLFPVSLLFSSPPSNHYSVAQSIWSSHRTRKYIRETSAPHSEWLTDNHQREIEVIKEERKQRNSIRRFTKQLKVLSLSLDRLIWQETPPENVSLM